LDKANKVVVRGAREGLVRRDHPSVRRLSKSPVRLMVGLYSVV
jgi:hypothetical protein